MWKWVLWVWKICYFLELQVGIKSGFPTRRISVDELVRIAFSKSMELALATEKWRSTSEELFSKREPCMIIPQPFLCIWLGSIHFSLTAEMSKHQKFPVTQAKWRGDPPSWKVRLPPSRGLSISLGMFSLPVPSPGLPFLTRLRSFSFCSPKVWIANELFPAAGSTHA